MVKRRGYRIELDEIESCLYRHPAIKAAAVVSVPNAESYAIWILAKPFGVGRRSAEYPSTVRNDFSVESSGDARSQQPVSAAEPCRPTCSISMGRGKAARWARVSSAPIVTTATTIASLAERDRMVRMDRNIPIFSSVAMT